MNKRNITEMVFKGVHPVAVSWSGFYHTSVIVFVNPMSKYYSDSEHPFLNEGKEWSDNWENVRYLTIGAEQTKFPGKDPLICDYNRQTDACLDNKVHFVNLTINTDVNNKIDDLLQCHEYYYVLSDEEKSSYELFAYPSNWHNSNSYATGIIFAVGIDDLGKPPYNVPGYDNPISSSFFGVEE